MKCPQPPEASIQWQEIPFLKIIIAAREIMQGTLQERPRYKTARAARTWLITKCKVLKDTLTFWKPKRSLSRETPAGILMQLRTKRVPRVRNRASQKVQRVQKVQPEWVLDHQPTTLITSRASSEKLTTVSLTAVLSVKAINKRNYTIL